jgi:uroporphyrin-III C-methyltransferase
MTGRKLVKLILAGALVLALGATAGVAAAAGSGRLYVVSTGPGDPEYITVKALKTIKEADLVLGGPWSTKALQEVLKGKKVEDPWKELWFYQGKPWMKELRSFKPAERPQIVAAKKRQRDEYVKHLKELLAQGKKVALLDGGDPTVFSRSFWITGGLDPSQVEIIPGVGAMTAAMAALKKASTGGGARFVALTAPFAFFGKKDPDDLARDLSREPGTLAFYMGLSQMGRIVTALKKFNPGDLPVAVVYYAGYPKKQKIVRGTLDTIVAKTAPEKEKWMGMIIVGRCLTGPNFMLP